MGKLIAVGAVLLVQVLLLGGLALALGWRPSSWEFPPRSSLACWGPRPSSVWVCSSPAPCGPKAVLALANLAWVLFLGLGLLLPVATLPTWAEPLASALPSGALGEAMLRRPGAWHLVMGCPGVLLAWSAACWALAGRLFRWAPSQNPSRRRTKRTPRSSNVGSAAAYPRSCRDLGGSCGRSRCRPAARGRARRPLVSPCRWHRRRR